MRTLHRSQLEEEVKMAEQTLARVEARLQIIEMENQMADYEIVIKNLA